MNRSTFVFVVQKSLIDSMSASIPMVESSVRPHSDERSITDTSVDDQIQVLHPSIKLLSIHPQFDGILMRISAGNVAICEISVNNVVCDFTQRIDGHLQAALSLESIQLQVVVLTGFMTVV